MHVTEGAARRASLVCFFPLLVACGSSSGSSHDAGAPRSDATGGRRQPDAAIHDAKPDVPADARKHHPSDAAGDATVGHDAGPVPFFDAGNCGVGPQGEPTDLSCTGLYSDWASKTISADVRPYTPGLALWSDGADKSRWIYLPPGTTIGTSDMDEWMFPIGTKLWKEFRVPVGGASTPTRIETRLIWKITSREWYRTTYRWSSDGQTAATELTLGQLDANGAGYEIPNQSLCNTCHSGRMDGVLGFEAVSLASPAAQGFALPELLEAGALSNPPDAALTIPGDPTAAAALGWLHVNCGEACHNGGQGEAMSTGFLMRLDVATLASVHATDTWATGWNQPTTVFQLADASTTYRFRACSLPLSAAYYRADRRDGVDGAPFGVQMPPVDTHRVDDAGMAILAAWIDEACDGGAGDAQ